MTAVALAGTRWIAGPSYTEADWATTFGHMLRSGPLLGVSYSCYPFADSTGRQVKVLPGTLWILGHEVDIPATVTLPVNPNLTGSTRIDRIIARVRVGVGIELECVAGTASPPALTQNMSIWEESLGQVTVANGASTIEADKVSYELTFAAACNATIPCYSYARPAHLYGRRIYELDTNRERISDGSTWRWVPGTGVEIGCDLVMTAGVNLSTSGSGGKITLESENWDGSTVGPLMHSSSDAHLVIPSDGIYDILASIQFAASGTALVGGGAGATWAAGAGKDRHLGLHKASGAEFTSGSPSHPFLGQQACYDQTVTTRLGRSKRFACAAGDWFTLVARQDQGAALKVETATLSARLTSYAS